MNSNENEHFKEVKCENFMFSGRAYWKLMPQIKQNEKEEKKLHSKSEKKIVCLIRKS